MEVKKKKIMIVDDAPVIHSLLKNILKKVNYRIEIIDAFSAQEAIDKFNSERPDIIFMDIIMEKHLSGVDVLKYIKKQNPEIPVIMVTSLRANDDVIKECVDAGADQYISKPFNNQDILSSLDPHL